MNEVENIGVNEKNQYRAWAWTTLTFCEDLYLQWPVCDGFHFRVYYRYVLGHQHLCLLHHVCPVEGQDLWRLQRRCLKERKKGEMERDKMRLVQKVRSLYLMVSR